MAYFPLFVDLSDYSCLIVGGGPVAYRKALILKGYASRIMVMAPAFHPDFRRQSGFFLLEKKFDMQSLKDADLVVAATDDRDLNHRIGVLCKEKGIPVNVADDKDACTFLFPALIRDEGIVIGITTSGASPALAGCLRDRIKGVLPQNLGAYAGRLEVFREKIKEIEPPALRKAVFYDLAVKGMDGSGNAKQLTNDWIDQIAEEIRKEIEQAKD